MPATVTSATTAREPVGDHALGVSTGHETPIFAAASGRRGRRLRAAAVVLAALVSLWLAALVAGMIGFGRLPSVSDLGGSAGSRRSIEPQATAGAASAAPTASARASAERVAADLGAVGTRARSSRRSVRHAAGQRLGTEESGPGSMTSPPRSKAPPAAAPVLAPSTTPRPGRRVGQTKSVASEPAPASSTSPGHGNGPSPTALEHRSPRAGETAKAAP